MKKPFWKTVLGRITERVLIIGLGMVVKNQKGVKGTKNEEIVDDLLK